MRPAVAQMSWDDLQVLGATLVVDEIAAVEVGDGLALLGQQLSHLSSEKRRALRAALADAPA